MTGRTERIIRVNGGKKLSGGRISIAGSSNQVTKCIIAAMLTNDEVVIKGAPDVEERKSVERLFRELGGTTETLDVDTIRLVGKDINQWQISEEICRRNRISVLCAGPLLHRFRKVSFFGTLGGDKIGKRPVNFHIDGLEKMGAQVEFDGNKYLLSIDDKGLQGAHITLPFPSVMATENLLITATLAKGRTIIENAAIEPEIIELVKMLQKMGADICWNSHRTFIVQGVKTLRGCELRCMVDRNQAVSFAVAALATGGDVLLNKVAHDPVYPFLNFIQRMGARFRVNSDGLYVEAPQGTRLKGAHIEVETHPGFMTDWQQPFMVLFTQADGASVLHETVFEERLGYSAYLNEMGAQINTSAICLGEAPCRFRNRNFTHSAIIQGPTALVARDFRLPTDIRAGKCLVIAGLVARGVTHLANIQEVERKYDNLVPKLQEMGADLQVIENYDTTLFR